MSSRCASSASQTMLTTTSESRSWVRICTTLGDAPPLAARIAEKSRSFVMRTNACSFAHVRISTSGAVGADGGPVDGLEPLTRQPVDPAWRQVHVHQQLHGWR